MTQKAHEYMERHEVADFLARVSVDVRTHMEGIMNDVDIASHEEMSPRVAECLQKVKNSADWMQRIMEDVLDLANISSNRAELNEEEYCVRDVENEIKKFLEKRSGPLGVEWDFSVDGKLPYRAYGDRERLKKMVEKLIMNAVFVTHNGKIAINVKMLPSPKGKAVIRFDFTDKGDGVLSEEILSILQGETPRTGSFEDDVTEQGNAIMAVYVYTVKYFASIMGGKLSVYCKKGEGTTFTLLVMQRTIGTALLEDFREAQKSNRIRAEFKAPKARVLVLDNDSERKKIIALLLKYEIYADTADTISEATALLENLEYDLFVVGSRIGMEVVREMVTTIRTMSRGRGNRKGMLKDMPILVVLEEDDPEFVEAMKKLRGTKTTKFLQTDDMSQAIMDALPDHLKEATKPNEEVNLVEVLDGLGIDVPYALENFNNDEEELKEVLRTLCRNSDTKTRMLRYYLEQHDYKNYIVAAHGILGVARMIGANWLAEQTARLEKAARQGLRDIIEKETDTLANSFERLLSSIGDAIITKDEKKTKGMISKQDLINAIMQLKGYLDDYQLNEIEELFYNLAQCSYPDEEVIALIHSAEEYMLNYQYNELRDILDKILIRLEQ